jgi:hypothetical protein
MALNFGFDVSFNNLQNLEEIREKVGGVHGTKAGMKN